MSVPEAEAGRAAISWARAVVSGLAIVVVVLGAAVLGANAILTHLTGLSRHSREYLATALFFAVLVGAAWGMRRLQARGLI